jgi:hypothetical protein
MSSFTRCACGRSWLPGEAPSTQFTRCPQCGREVVVPGQARRRFRRPNALTLGLLLATLLAATLLALGVYGQVQDAADRTS